MASFSDILESSGSQNLIQSCEESRMNSNKDFCRWLGNLRLSRILILVAIALITIPLFSHYYLSSVQENDAYFLEHRTRNKLDNYDDYSALKASDLRMRIDEMIRIKGSVSTELRDLEAKRQKLQNEIAVFTRKIELLKNELGKHQTELNRLKLSVIQAQVAEREVVERNSPELAPPLILEASSLPAQLPPPSDGEPSCSMATCFDYSRCPLTSGLPVYLYDVSVFPASLFLKTAISQTVEFNGHFTSDPNEACLFLVLVGEGLPPNLTTLSQLPYWGGDGRNHVLMTFTRSNLSESVALVPSKDTGRAMIAQSHHPAFRPNFDITIGAARGPPGGPVWSDAAFMLPARRRYLFSFQGFPPTSNSTSPFNITELLQYVTQDTMDEVLLDAECSPSESEASSFDAISSDWKLCGDETSRLSVLHQSTFALIPGDLPSTAIRLYEALKAASVPIILSSGPHPLLPFNEVVRWRGASMAIPWARLPEVHFLARTVSDADLADLRRRGRGLWQHYLASLQAIIDTTLALVSDRLLIPPHPAFPAPSPDAFPPTFTPLKTEPILVDAEPEESLGPLEPPYASPAFRRNFSLYLTQGHELWNEWYDPFHLYPYLPFDPVLPSDAKFMGSGMGFRPIGGGAGGAGREFCDSLGGNQPREQFTIVMLTYEREQVLMNSLSRLHGLPYLHKVVVVWNTQKPPLPDLRWPDIGVPISVVKGVRNSLNNRFLPFDAIETEAVLSVDDDAHLRHDEIIFGFRVWREQRDRIVGFPGRFHALDLNHGGWLYNSNYSCELSMVLTGAAFVHKYYLYLYSHWLPQAVRDKVDEYMNCEDIAMNFLVSHVTRKPPIKVTSRWTFRCPGCPVTLSEDDTHFQERHKCINYFSQVLGYTPLLNTQFRADSILFKTRIPHDKQKCFKFI